MSNSKTDVAVEILRAIGPAMTLAQTGLSIVNRLQAGKLTEEQAAAEWTDTQRHFQQGAAAWDQAAGDA